MHIEEQTTGTKNVNTEAPTAEVLALGTEVYHIDNYYSQTQIKKSKITEIVLTAKGVRYAMSGGSGRYLQNEVFDSFAGAKGLLKKQAEEKYNDELKRIDELTERVEIQTTLGGGSFAGGIGGTTGMLNYIDSRGSDLDDADEKD